ncbi:hypothetical protein [Desertivirga brevis]|uniref:hypothetical protein n=1 Tax=Desertivirga brevis TaxID=2810310 RepID=UPI001A961044|nr:hypothetical protein [Pedobacter sp. SYSU D00873]
MIDDNQILHKPFSASINISKIEYPVSFQFKIGTFANDFIATDASGRTIAFVRQKMFKFKDAIMIYSDESKTELLYQINADKWIDFNASYSFSDGNDIPLGSVGRKGMKSLWKASYQIFDASKVSEFNVREENPWAKVFDALLSEVPFLGLFTGYFFHPKYTVANEKGVLVARLSKESSFFGRKFRLDKLEDLEPAQSERIILGLMMMVLLERRRG